MKFIIEKNTLGIVIKKITKLNVMDLELILHLKVLVLF